MKANEAKIVFFGGEPLGVPTLQKLYEAGIVPKLIVCNPDRPSGRGQKLTSPPVKVWAETHNIEVFQPTTYKDKEQLKNILENQWDLFVVVAYNFILPKWFLELPKNGVINVHPSLLPKLRGASPIRSAILHDVPDAVGVSVMLMDEQMDHGPILMQEKVTPEYWPIAGPLLDEILATRGGELLVKAIPAWLQGNIEPQEQNHEEATYTKRFEKTESQLTLNPTNLPTGNEAVTVLNKILAFAGIGDTFFEYNNVRVKIKQAELAPDGSLRLLRVIPAGKPEIDFNTYLQTLNS